MAESRTPSPGEQPPAPVLLALTEQVTTLQEQVRDLLGRLSSTPSHADLTTAQARVAEVEQYNRVLEGRLYSIEAEVAATRTQLEVAQRQAAQQEQLALRLEQANTLLGDLTEQHAATVTHVSELAQALAGTGENVEDALGRVRQLAQLFVADETLATALTQTGLLVKSTRLSGDFTLTASQNLGFFGVSPVVRQARGATLTNNVTASGTSETIPDITDGVVYANDYANIRAALYWLAHQGVQQDVAFQAYGLLT